MNRVDAALRRVELFVAMVCGSGLLVSLCSWVVLKGLAARSSSAFQAGLLLRAGVLGALGALLVSRLTTKTWPRWVGAGVGVLLALPLRDVGAGWAENVVGWLQDGSSLTLFGGVRGVATRLTLVLVMTGAAMATATGRHVTIDVAARAFGESLGAWLRRGTGVVTIGVCVAAGWGFFDFISIDGLGGSASSTLRRDVFVLGRQLALDVRLAPRVVMGARWDTALTGAEWNAWLEAGDWSGVVDAAGVEAMKESGATRAPLVSLPGVPSRGLLVKPLGLVIPFGLWWLALRFLVWVLRGAPVEEPELKAAPEVVS